MAETTIVGRFSYWPNEEDSIEAKYTDQEDLVTIMRAPGESVIELKVQPDAGKHRDALYIRIPAQKLMAALTEVFLGDATE